MLIVKGRIRIVNHLHLVVLPGVDNIFLNPNNIFLNPNNIFKTFKVIYPGQIIDRQNVDLRAKC